MDTITIRKVIESIEKELRRAKTLIESPDSKQPNIRIENVMQDLQSFTPSPIDEYEFVSATASEKEIEEEITKIEEKRVNLSIDDVVLQLKYGNDEDLNYALSGFNESIKQGLITNDWITEEGIILVLVNRLSSCKPNNSLIILVNWYMV
ncbi:hypothetical protein HRI_000237300 [Hibiscus trionum]|uniref:Uncharacterized protein n=1 Tax=Hibiscus trionum TaxID=183268 RepID=A0A9W7GXG5_HIBTR|nr:hypothetical protein HRI_000237300 [Hibiscus trionum]